MTKAIDTASDAAYQNEARLFLPTLGMTWAEPPTPKAVAPTAPASRKRRVDWAGSLFNAAWMALMLSCTGGCVARLLWAVTP